MSLRTTYGWRRALGTCVCSVGAIAGLAAATSAQQVPIDTTAVPMAASDSLSVVRVCAGGDVTLGTNLDTTWTRRAAGARGVARVRALPPPASLLAPLEPLLEDADFVLLNVEGAIGNGPVSRQKCRPGSTMCYAFRQPSEAAAALAGVAPNASVVGNVANNHARDAGWDGLAETRRLLEAARVAVTGMDTIPTPVANARGDTVAFLGYSTSGGPDPRVLDAVRRHVARASERWPRVVVTMHMGAEGISAQRTPDSTEMFIGIDRGNMVAFARAAAESGAGLVVGHGPHVMRGAEWWGETLIAYSLGNLVTYGPFSMGEPLNRGGLLCADLDSGGRVTQATLRSTRQRSAGLVEPDATARAAILADSLSALDFPETGARFRTETRILKPLAPAP
ncbi:MAG TPA: CapA family protein [Gemmatimonadaceae bacterium]|nr:CapA family protein [Gemmatimonadaceae bacterium]